MSYENGFPTDPADESEPKPNPIQRVGRHIQGKVGSGLLEVLPVLITVIVIVYIVNFIDRMMDPILAFLAERGLWFPYIDEALTSQALTFPGIGIVVGVIAFYLIGLFISMKPGKKATSFLVRSFGRIPVVKGIFGVTQQITSVITSDFGFSRVVFIEWPREGMIAMGFVTARVRASRGHKSLVMVYIPTIPNPTSGNMALVVEDDVMETDLAVDDAMKLIFSGGVVPPDDLSIARVPGVEPRTDLDFLGRFYTDRH